LMFSSAALAHGGDPGGPNDTMATSYGVELPPWSFVGVVILLLFWAILCCVPCVCGLGGAGSLCMLCSPCSFKLVPQLVLPTEPMTQFVPTSETERGAKDIISREINAEAVFALALPMVTLAVTGLAASVGGAFLGAGGATSAAQDASYVVMTGAGLRRPARLLQGPGALAQVAACWGAANRHPARDCKE